MQTHEQLFGSYRYDWDRQEAYMDALQKFGLRFSSEWSLRYIGLSRMHPEKRDAWIAWVEENVEVHAWCKELVNEVFALKLGVK